MTIQRVVELAVIYHPGYCTNALYRRWLSHLKPESVTNALYRLQAKGLIHRLDNPQGGWYPKRRNRLVSGWLSEPMFAVKP